MRHKRIISHNRMRHHTCVLSVPEYVGQGRIRGMFTCLGQREIAGGSLEFRAQKRKDKKSKKLYSPWQSSAEVAASMADL